ncbi:UNVERIFIED_CONTAM: Transcription factor GTE10 [Sesamum latifolium]|uniref:Transcription factor GTE10 n=1 Tax=Sesamum latifolium TaxID=2727402 RepID=A0AAW2YEA8_9LAMI
MAPTIPIDYTGHRESRKFSKTGSVFMMGKTRKVSKGHSTGFVPDYRHAVETMAESEGFGSSGRLDTELTASQDSCIPSSKRIGLNVDGYDRSVVPIRFLSLKTLERRDLEVRLRSELEQVRKLQRKIASYTFDAADVYSFQNGAKRPAMVESLPMSTNDAPMAPGKKKCTSGRNGPRTKGGPVAARRNESVKQGPHRAPILLW